jgi:xanthine/uracil/vitamin C permease (AzgA family)
LITALAGATEINLVVRGKYTILDMGEMTNEIVIAMANLVIVAVLLHYHVKGAFCCGLMVGTVLWWIVDNAWPEGLILDPHTQNHEGDPTNNGITLLVFNLFFLFILTLNGLARSLSDLGGLTKPNGAIPRGKFLFLVCGLTTMLSGYMSGPPVLISPETAAGIKAGAKTGLSTLVCGVLFGVAAFFSPLFAAVPPAGTAPLLIMVGVMMFGNGKRIDWTDYKLAVPAYCVLFFIPFTYSILRGVAFGYIIYILIGLFTGDMIENTLNFIKSYQEPWYGKDKGKPLATKELPMDDHEDDGFDNMEDQSDSTDNKPKNIIQRTIMQLNKVLDSQDIEGDTNVTSTAEQGNIY